MVEAEFKSKQSSNRVCTLTGQSRTGISSSFLGLQKTSPEMFLLDEDKVQTQPLYICLQLRSPALKQDLLRSPLCCPHQILYFSLKNAANSHTFLPHLLWCQQTPSLNVISFHLSSPSRQK